MTGKVHSDEELVELINEHAHQLHELEEGDAPDRVERIREVQVELDRLWDLRRRRDAQHSYDLPVEDEERPESVVENYLQ